MTFGRRFLCSSDAHSMLGNELSTLGAGHVAARAAVAAASSSGLIWTDDRNVAWCSFRCPTVDGEGQHEPGIHARCATASPASPARTFRHSTLHAIARLPKPQAEPTVRPDARRRRRKLDDTARPPRAGVESTVLRGICYTWATSVPCCRSCVFCACP